MFTNIKDIPYIAHMTAIRERNFEEHKKPTDNSYYNSSLDIESDYCQNTSSWD